ncbi:MAG: hypothetical protein AAFR81_11125 [Chloroflexota bacterium]
MGISIRWADDEQTRLWFIFESTWTLDQFKQAVVDSAQMIRKQAHPVHLIADIRAVEALQMAIAVEGASFAARYIMPQLGAVVIINTNSLLKTAITCVQGFLRPLAGRMYTVANPTLAERIITHVEDRSPLRV